jgi:hypothetical protein
MQREKQVSTALAAHPIAWPPCMQQCPSQVTARRVTGSFGSDHTSAGVLCCCTGAAGWNNRVRPSSAPVQQRAVGLNANSNTRSTAGSLQQQQQQQPHAAHDVRQHHKQQLISSSTTTQKGVPCCSVSMLMDVDLMTGQPASVDMCTTQPWRVARVKTRPVSHSCCGHGEGGKHAQHQSYGFYKYYGEQHQPPDGQAVTTAMAPLHEATACMTYVVQRQLCRSAAHTLTW